MAGLAILTTVKPQDAFAVLGAPGPAPPPLPFRVWIDGEELQKVQFLRVNFVQDAIDVTDSLVDEFCTYLPGLRRDTLEIDGGLEDAEKILQWSRDGLHKIVVENTVGSLIRYEGRGFCRLVDKEEVWGGHPGRLQSEWGITELRMTSARRSI